MRILALRVIIIDAQQGSDVYQKAIWANMQKRYDSALESKKYRDDPDYRQQTIDLGKTLTLRKIYINTGQSSNIEYRGAELIFDKDGSIKRSNNVKFEVMSDL